MALELADGSLVMFGENTNVNISTLAADAQASAWTARLELLRGSLKIVLAEGFQSQGASFTVQTDNTLVTLKPSPDTEADVVYDPNAGITTVLAHQSDLMIKHLLNEVSAVIPAGHSGIIYNHVIQEVARILDLEQSLDAPAEAEAPGEGEEETEDAAEEGAAEEGTSSP